MFSKVITVTPQLAMAWLLRNIKNRKIAPSRVAYFKRLLNTKQFELVPDGLSFYAVSGRPLDTATVDRLLKSPDEFVFLVLANGQHRLTAIVETGISAEMNVTFDVPRTAGSYLDDTYRRSAGHNFQRTGQSYSNDRAARCRAILSLERPGEYTNIPFPELENVNDFYSMGLDWSLEFCKSRAIFGTTGVTSTLAYAYASNPERVAAFADKLYSGLGLKAGDPETALRRYLEKVIGTGSLGGAKHYQRQMWATVQAVTAALNGEKLTKITVNHPKSFKVRETMLQQLASAYKKSRKSLVEPNKTVLAA